MTTKIVLVGNTAIGKSTLVLLIQTGAFVPKGVDEAMDICSSEVIALKNDTAYNVGLWDSIGKESYDGLRPLSYPSSNLFLVLFSVDNMESFHAIKEKWLPEITHHMPGTPWILVGTKTDLRDDPNIIAQMHAKHQRGPIEYAEGKSMAAKCGAQTYVEVSSLRKEGTQELMQAILNVHIQFFDSETHRARNTRGATGSNRTICALL